MIHRLTTSLRECSADETFQRAKLYMDRLGISRITDSTRLDRIGIPVFSSIRPSASEASLCVHAGKGTTPTEARTGALMEAIEFAFADPSNSNPAIRKVLPEDILGKDSGFDAILDLCPRMNIEIKMDVPIPSVKALELNSRQELDVPAELAFTPFDQVEEKYFGSHTNGLSSGNSIAEATIHGILEVVERDAVSFQTFKDDSYLINSETLPASLKSTLDKIEHAGLEIIVKYVNHESALPVFMCWLIEPFMKNPIYINKGYGCHINKSIAITRAVTEAVQSRMSFIHGGRDDLVRDYEYFEAMTDEQRTQHFDQNVQKLQSSKNSISYDDIGEVKWNYQKLDEGLELLLTQLGKRDYDKVLRAVHTRADDSIHVVKVIIPKMEFFTFENKRVGPKLHTLLNEIADHNIRRT